jgi:hypothetical protein
MLFSEIDSSMLSVITGFVLLVLGVVTRVLIDERKVVKETRIEMRELANKHEDCLEDRGRITEEVGGLKEVVRILSNQHGHEIKRQVETKLVESEQKGIDKAAEIKSNRAS